MDSFGEIFPDGAYYDATNDPCTLDFTGLTTGAIAGFHAHPRFSTQHPEEMAEGIGCGGNSGPYTALDATAKNQENVTFTEHAGGDDYDWVKAPPDGTGTPSYLLRPDTERILKLDENEQISGWWVE